MPRLTVSWYSLLSRYWMELQNICISLCGGDTQIHDFQPWGASVPKSVLGYGVEWKIQNKVLVIEWKILNSPSQTQDPFLNFFGGWKSQFWCRICFELTIWWKSLVHFDYNRVQFLPTKLCMEPRFGTKTHKYMLKPITIFFTYNWVNGCIIIGLNENFLNPFLHTETIPILKKSKQQIAGWAIELRYKWKMQKKGLRWLDNYLAWVSLSTQHHTFWDTVRGEEGNLSHSLRPCMTLFLKVWPQITFYYLL